MKKILITGGAGYIGSKIVSDLINKNYKVFIVDNLSTGSKFLINKKAIFYKCNIGNTNQINKILKKNKIESIIHCAASLDVGESERNPEKYFRNNYLNTVKLLEVCCRNNLKNFIFSSTCAVYGNVKGLVTEETKTNPTSVYGKTKLKCEKSIKFFSNKYNFNYGILRYFNVAGSDLKNKIGCIKKNDQLIKNISFYIARKNFQISVYGNNYNTKDGTCIRDYIFIDDISKVHLTILKLISKTNKSYTLNCGYGSGYSVLDIIKNFENELKINIKKNFLPRRKGDISEIIASTNKIKKYVSLSKKNKLKKIIGTAVKWEKFLQKRNI